MNISAAAPSEICEEFAASPPVGLKTGPARYLLAVHRDANTLVGVEDGAVGSDRERFPA